MTQIILQAILYALRTFGIWEKLQAEHRAQELSKATQGDNRLTDDDVIKQLHERYNRD